MLTVLLYTAPALIAMHGAVVGDPDVWWHLRTGEWIIQHRSVPHTDSFTTFGAGQPWAAYSWLFELILFGLFRCFGLYGIVLYTGVMILGITVAVHRITQRSLGNTPASVLLTFGVCFSMGHLYTPRPWLLTIFFFAVELDAILRFRQNRSLRSIIFLPVLFALWVNVHIQFIDGLAVLGLACADEAWTTFRQHDRKSRPAIDLIAVTLLCCVATLANPYGFHIYHVARDLATQSGVLNTLQELQAMPFRDPVDWTVLALAMASVGTLARQRRPSPFHSLLLTFGIVLAFRSQRDVWVLAIVSAATLAIFARPNERTVLSSLARYNPSLIGAALLLLLASSRYIGIRNCQLEKRLVTSLPVSAAEYIRRVGYSGPIFNDYGWGGYLMWSLHQKVCIDGRAALQGDKRIAESIATWGGQPAWEKNPDLLSSNLILGQRNAPLSQLLRKDSQFTLLYEDDLAVVFARRHKPYTAR